MILISAMDDAWDVEKVDDQLRDQYFSGATRFDLAADLGDGRRVADYLAGTPTKFLLRRIPPHELAVVRDEVESRDAADIGWHQIWTRVATSGLAGIEDDAITYRRGPNGKTHPSVIQELYDTGGHDLLTEIGVAVYRVSESLSVAEKKR